MIEEEIEIAATDGTSDAVLFRPEGERRLPGVIFLTDIRGIRPATRDMARRLAAEDYCVLMPNVFYRTSRPPVFDFPMRIGEERSMKRIAELAAPVTPEAMERDASDYVDFLAGRDSVSEGPMGVVGHCFTGPMAMRVAAARPDRIAAATSFHGVRLFTDDAASPHLVLPRVKARLYFAHAVNDNSMPQEAIEKFNRALEAWNPSGDRYESEVYEGAYHGWTAPDSPVYNEAQAERAFRKLAELFAETLSCLPRRTRDG
ncbi:MAG: dienelactone hydrolase family protein [Blastocatellia bacterium]|nr:dienelactone hydrolase family protein [Blastocatellia bacterium]